MNYTAYCGYFVDVVVTQLYSEGLIATCFKYKPCKIEMIMEDRNFALLHLNNVSTHQILRICIEAWMDHNSIDILSACSLCH